jgi:hypothetical protein
MRIGEVNMLNRKIVLFLVFLFLRAVDLEGQMVITLEGTTGRVDS